MRLHRFFVDRSLEEATLTITDTELLHQWSKVLRYKGGEELALIDGRGGEVTGKLLSCSPKQAEFQVETRSQVESQETPVLTLYFSPLKRDLTELVFQKGTELGVSIFQPMVCERTVRDGFNPERVTRILKEAMEQSGQCWLPVCHAPISFKEAVKRDHANTKTYFASLSSETTSPQKKNFTPSNLSLFVGPEGGWSETEEELAKAAGFEPIRLSRHVLRAETACIAGIALLRATSLV